MSGCVAVRISLAVFVLEVVRHVAVFVKTGYIVGADAYALRIDGQHFVALRQCHGQLARGNKAAEDDVQRGIAIGVKARQQNIADALDIAYLPGHREVDIRDDLAAVGVYCCGNFCQAAYTGQRRLGVGVGGGATFGVHVVHGLVFADIQLQIAGGWR